MINEIFHNGWHFFQYFSSKFNFKNLLYWLIEFFCLNGNIFVERTAQSDKKKFSNSGEKLNIKLDDLRKNAKKMNLRGNFCNYRIDYLSEFFSVNRYFITSVCSVKRFF